MRFVHTLFHPARWEWFAAGDPNAEFTVERKPSDENSAQRVMYEVGLFLLVPLALAALIEIIFGA
jgi:uncharacterized protein involved in type VI secretion and phage assembly